MGKYTDKHKDEFPSPPTRLSDEYKETEADRILNMINGGNWVEYAGLEGSISDGQQVSTWHTINYVAQSNGQRLFVKTYVRTLKLPLETFLDQVSPNPIRGNYDPAEAKDLLKKLRNKTFDETGADDINGQILREYYQFYGYVLGVPENSLPRPISEAYIGDNRNTVFAESELSLNREIEDWQDVLVYLYLQPENIRKNNLDDVYSRLQDAGVEELANKRHSEDNASATEALKYAAAKSLAQTVDAGYDLTDEQSALLEDLQDEEKLQERILQSTNCLIKLNLGQYMRASYALASSQNDSGVRDSWLERYEPEVYKGYGDCTDFINKLAYNPKSARFLNSRTSEQSSLIPMIRLFKTYHDKGNSKITKEVEFTFDGGTTTGVLNPKGRVGIKSFDWKLNSTNPATIRNDIEATLVLYFQSFNDLLSTRMGTDTISAQPEKYKYEDLLIRPPVNAPKQSITDPSDGVDCRREDLIYDPSFYEVKAIVGWAPTGGAPRNATFEESAASQQLPLFLTLIDHEFNFTQQGTFELKITYRARMESVLNDPRMDVFSTKKMKERMEEISEKISDLKKTCGRDKLVERYREQIEIIREEGRDNFAETLISGLEKNIYITKVNKVELVQALVNLSFGEDTEDFKRRTGLSINKKGEIVQGGVGETNRTRTFAGSLSAAQTREANQPVIGLSQTTKSVIAQFSRRNATLKDEVRKQLRERLVDSYSKSHPVSKREQEEASKGFVEKVGDHYENSTGWDLAANVAAGALPGGPIASVLSNQTARNALASGLETGAATIGLETESMLNKRGIYRRENPTPANAYIYRDNNLEDVGFLQDGNALYMPWFYFGDLINLAVDHCFNNVIGRNNENNSSVPMEYLKNLIILMGPFNLYGNGPKGEVLVNGSLGDVPISVELFNRWYVRRVIDAERSNYPLLEFLRDVAKDLVLPVLNRRCFDTIQFRRSWTEARATWWETRNVILKTAAVSLPSKRNLNEAEGVAKRKAFINDVGANPLEQYSVWGSAYSGLNASSQIRFDEWTAPTQTLTRRKNSYEQTINNSYHIFALYVIQQDNYRELGPPLTGQTREERDLMFKGIYHLFLAADRGLVKEASFTKVDAPYLREARIQQDSLNPLAQLAATYNCTLKLIGNTIFWPGQYIYVNPVGYGSGLGQPDLIGSPSNQLGLGGYHLVTGVTSFIEDGKFMTEVKALFEFSGDGCPSLPQAQDSSNCSKGPPGPNTRELGVPSVDPASLGIPSLEKPK